MVSVKNHRNASYNPYAQCDERIDLGNGKTIPSSEITIEQAQKASHVNFCDTTNGAAVCILASEAGIRRIQKARGRLRHPVIVSGIGYAHNDISGDDSDCEMLAKDAISQAYKDAHITYPFWELDVVELHDQDASSEIRGYEDVGLCPKGNGGKFIDEGFPFLDTVDYGSKVRPFPRLRSVAVNPSGGLMACGYAGAATNLRQIIFGFWQIQGSINRHFGTPTLQVPNAKRCAIYSQSQTGDTASVTVLQR